jgi:hypothetical protein
MNKLTLTYEGGLGNQLFQIYTLLSFYLDENNNYELYFEHKTISPSVTLRKTYWNSIFKQLKTRFDNTDAFSNDWFVVLENDIGGYSKHQIIESNKNINFYGSFQNFNNFIHNVNEINQLLDIENQINKVRNDNNFILSGDTIGIHFRLGDYKKFPQHHPILPENYYINALKDIKNIESKKFLIFYEKEDLEYVMTKLKTILNILNIQIAFELISGDEVHDMFLMSCCKEIIIANSTYSWWSGFFSKNSKVYIPYIWCNFETRKELICDEWNVIYF